MGRLVHSFSTKDFVQTSLNKKKSQNYFATQNYLKTYIRKIKNQPMVTFTKFTLNIQTGHSNVIFHEKLFELQDCAISF